MEHRQKIMDEAAEALMGLTLTRQEAMRVVSAIADGEIPHITITLLRSSQCPISYCDLESLLAAPGTTFCSFSGTMPRACQEAVEVIHHTGQSGRSR